MGIWLLYSIDFFIALIDVGLLMWATFHLHGGSTPEPWMPVVLSIFTIKTMLEEVAQSFVDIADEHQRIFDILRARERQEIEEKKREKREHYQALGLSGASDFCRT